MKIFFKCPLFATVQLESFVTTDHPLRPIKALLDKAMKRLNWLFNGIYSDSGRESISPERLIRAQLLQVLYSIRSERQLVEQITCNLWYRWFIGLTIEDTVWNQATFSINLDRLLENDVITQLFEEVVGLDRKQRLLSDEHFSVDGALIQAWASQKSYRCKNDKGEPPAVATVTPISAGRSCSNEIHESKADGDARLASGVEAG